MSSRASRVLVLICLTVVSCGVVVGANAASSRQQPARVVAVPTAAYVSVQDQWWFVMRWTGSSGATGYRLYLNGVQQATTTDTAYNFTPLTCGTGYTLGVAAYSSTRSSAVESLKATTSPCSNAPVADTTAPSVPGAPVATGVTATTATVAWAAASDNVAVTGYNVFLSGKQVGQTSGLSATVSGLACSGLYPVSIDAFDAAGNTSGQASVTVATSKCVVAPSPTTTTTPKAPTPPPTTTTTTTPVVPPTTTTAPVAPPTTTTTPVSGGVWAASSFLNTPLSNFQLNPSSASWLSQLQGSEGYGLWVDYQDWTPAIYHATSATSTATISVSNTQTQITVPYQASYQPDPTSDAQLAVINTSNGCEYEFDGFDPTTMTAHAEATFNINTGTGIHADDAGVTGSNISTIGGIITAKDVNSGVINHALRYVTPIGSATWIAPASRSDGTQNGGIPAGEVMRLDPTLNLTGLGLTPFQTMVALALQKYGAYNSDAGGSFKITAENTISGASYNTAISALPWTVTNSLQFGTTTLGNTTTNNNSDPNCNEQH